MAGFGGSLLLLPVLVHLVGPAQAIPLFTVAGLISNAARSILGFRVIAWRAVGMFLLGVLPGAVAGSFTFVEVPPALVQRALGVFLLALMLVHRSLLKRPWPTWALPAAGFCSAFLSGVFGFSGPLNASIFFSLNLSPASYIASEATTAVVTHFTKAVTYRSLNALGSSTLLWGLYVGAVMSVGAVIGRKLIDRIPAGSHATVVRVLFALVAVSLLV